LRILISNKAEKQLRSLPQTAQQRIREIFIQLYAAGIKTNIDIKKLKGHPNHFRVRIGEYRVRFEFEKPDLIKIYWIGKRSKAYED